jgi:hypothetical protein
MIWWFGITSLFPHVTDQCKKKHPKWSYCLCVAYIKRSRLLKAMTLEMFIIHTFTTHIHMWKHCKMQNKLFTNSLHASPSGCMVQGMGLQPLASLDCRFESHLGHGHLSVVSVVCCQVEVSAMGWSLVQSSPAKSGVSVRDHETSIMRRPWPTSGCYTMKLIL